MQSFDLSRIESFLIEHPMMESKDFIVARERLQKIVDIREFSHTFSIPKDGNCLIYSVVISLFYIAPHNILLQILAPFCPPEIVDVLFDDPSAIVFNHDHMKNIASNIRTFVIENWDWKGDHTFHMDQNAIDGLARISVLRALCVDRLTRFTLCDDPQCHENWCNFDDVKGLIRDDHVPNLRTDVRERFNVTTLSTYGYGHYQPLVNIK
jgi:hypothetical protein